MNKRNKQSSGRCVTFDRFVSMILSVLYHFFSFPEIEQVDSGVKVSDLFSESAQFDCCPGHLPP